MADLVVERVLRHLATLPDQPIGRLRLRGPTWRRCCASRPRAGPRPRGGAAPLRRPDRALRLPRQPPALPRLRPRQRRRFAAVLGDWLCAGHNFFAGVWLEASACARSNSSSSTGSATCSACPPATGGVLTSGGSEANLTALVVARDRLPSADRGRAVLYAGRQRHWSIDRAANVIGLLPDQVRLVDVDGRQRLRSTTCARRRRRPRPRAGCRGWSSANAGATSTGAVDPLAALADLCRDERLWLHVDAAYGWAAVLDPEGRRALDGIGRADSVTLDPHKWLAQPFEVGCLLVRDGRCSRPDVRHPARLPAGRRAGRRRGQLRRPRHRADAAFPGAQGLAVGPGAGPRLVPPPRRRAAWRWRASPRPPCEQAGLRDRQPGDR